MFYNEFCQITKNTFLRTPLVAASVVSSDLAIEMCLIFRANSRIF